MPRPALLRLQQWSSRNADACLFSLLVSGLQDMMLEELGRLNLQRVAKLTIDSADYGEPPIRVWPKVRVCEAVFDAIVFLRIIRSLGCRVMWHALTLQEK